MPYSHHSHSGQFCRHASGTLQDVVLEAIKQGFQVFGLTEHVPRYRLEDLYPEEAGLSSNFLIQQFIDFVKEAHRLKSAYAHQITILVGLETELITHDDLDRLAALLSEHTGRIEYIVGSIHHVNGVPIDFDHATFDKALRSVGQLGDDEAVAEMHANTTDTTTDRDTNTDNRRMDAFLSAYFDAQYELLRRFHPEVVGHLDVCRLYNPGLSLADFPRAWTRLRRNVAYAVGYGALFEVNAAALRKGWRTPFPGQDVVTVIREMGGRFTLSDDSHGPHRVGENYVGVRTYLREMGIGEVWYLTRDASVAEGEPYERGLYAARFPGEWWKHDFWKGFATGDAST